LTHPKGDSPIQVLRGALYCARWREPLLDAPLRRRHIWDPRALLLSGLPLKQFTRGCSSNLPHNHKDMIIGIFV
jgi:hypothetical protein